jgi:hypothetical protein
MPALEVADPQRDAALGVERIRPLKPGRFRGADVFAKQLQHFSFVGVHDEQADEEGGDEHRGPDGHPDEDGAPAADDAAHDDVGRRGVERQDATEHRPARNCGDVLFANHSMPPRCIVISL